MDTEWDRLEAWLGAAAPSSAQASLAPPASEELLETLERALRCSLHPDVRSTLLRHNGHTRGQETFFLHGFALCSAKQMLEHAEEGCDPEWDATSLPFAFSNSGELIYIANQKGGAVHRFVPEEGHFWLASNLREWLGAVCRSFEGDRVTFDPESGMLMSKGFDYEPEPELFRGDLIGDSSEVEPLSPNASAAELDRAIGLSPNNPDLYVARAALRRTSGNLKGARADLEAARRETRNDPRVTHLLAEVLVALGESSDARTMLERFLENVGTRTEFFGEVRFQIPPEAEAANSLYKRLTAEPG